MPVPDFQSVIRPLLELASDGKEHSLAEAREQLGETFRLTEEEKKALLPSGKQATFTNRVAWARVYLGQAGALESPRRGYLRISERGLQLLRDVPERITIRDLERFSRIPQIQVWK
jgi:restriction system protein